MTEQPATAQIGKYQILSTLGKGAYATVYRARDTVLQREVALKVLHPVYLLDAQALARFRQEAQALAGLVHPQIAFAWDFGEEQGQWYIATRLIQGESLDKLLVRQGRLSWEKALEYVRQIAEALEYAHGRGMVHRDLKPANIVIGQEEGAVLTDFGLVKALESSGLTSSTGSMLGTPAYIAPEIC